jgi:putative spermidine/putrescine transport system substrate-binding protein
MSQFKITRRDFVGGTAGAAGLMMFGGPAFAKLAMPSSPVALNVVDVAGNLALTQKAIEAYAKAKPDAVSRFTFNKAPAPELPGKLKAMEDAGRVDIDLVLTGNDALAAGVTQDLWIKLVPDHSDQLPDLQNVYLPAAWNMQGLAQGYGVVVTYYPSGPLIEYIPDRVKEVPTTTDELLAWAKAHPNRFMYARPANSGPGRTFIMGMPYLLGDSDPQDPEKGWDKTWAYLKELGKYVEYYPSGTTPTMKELGEGSRDIIATTTGWDINPRVLGIVPKEAKVGSLKGFHWVSDAHYMCVPKGISDDKLAVLLDLMTWLLQPAQQAYTYDEGYFYPGPAVKGVTLDMAPADSQAAIKEYGRPEYADLIANNPIDLPLTPEKMVTAFRIWDEQVGAQKIKQ